MTQRSRPRLGGEKPEVIECRGDPRAMGLAQGRSCRRAMRARVAHSGLAMRKRVLPLLSPLASGPVLGRGPGCELIRHYPHLSERMQGLASGADLSFEVLVDLFLRAARAAAPNRELSAEAALLVGSADEQGGLVVARPLVENRLPGSAWILRHSRPEVGFASHEVTLPWLASAVAGVNECGVAVAIAPGRLAAGSDARDGSFEPPAVLLVQECLQRFSDVQGCADWCSKRPASGRASMVLADATHGALALEIAGSERRVVPLDSGYWLAGGGEALRSRLGDRLVGAGQLDLGGLAALYAPDTDVSEADAGFVVALEPGARRLTLQPLGDVEGAAAIGLELASARVE